MDELTLDERFADLESITAGTFRPAPTAVVMAEAQRRRRSRRFTLAAVGALLVAAPVGGFAMAGGHPQPSPTPPDTLHVVQRVIPSPGQGLALRSVQFVQDGNHAWAWFQSSCDDDYRTCRYAIERTTDAGATWHRLTLPELAADDAPADILPLDGNTLTIEVIGKRFWLTTDGGRTFTQAPAKSPPNQAKQALAPGGLMLLCPGEIGFEDGAGGIECDRRRLVRIGSGPVQPQPTLPGQLDTVTTGGDGRIWLVSIDGNRERVAVSDDGAKTWQEFVPLPDISKLLISPDGHDVWAMSTTSNRLWKVIGSEWMLAPDLPDHTGVAAAGGGWLAVANGNAAGFVRDGIYTPVKGLVVDNDKAVAGVVDHNMRVLPDGSVVFSGSAGTFVGTGTGADRIWIHFNGYMSP
jgi:hypothetical protein